MSNRSYKVLLVGAMPPPIGGVTIHLQRFLEAAAANGRKVSLLDLRRWRICSAIASDQIGLRAIFLAFLKADLVHIHVANSLKLAIAVAARLFFKRVVYTHHNNVVKSRRMLRYLVGLCHHVIFVNDQCLKRYFDGAIDGANVSVVPAFLPPGGSEPLSETLSAELQGYSKVVVTNCYRLSYVDGEELYGFDLVVKAYKRLVAEGIYSSVLFVALDPSGTYEGQMESWFAGFDHKGSRFLYLNTEDISFFELLKKSTCSIRATRTDGDALSVRESLFCGVPVIASDVVDRPLGCKLYKNGDADDLYARLLEVLSDGAFKEIAPTDFFEEVDRVYDRVMGA